MDIEKIKKLNAVEKGIGDQYFERVFNELLAFQGYGFCRSHATAYSIYSAVQMWMQEHYFIEYMAVLLTHVDRANEKNGVGKLDERVQYCLSHGTIIHYPDIHVSGSRWQIKGGSLIAPLSNIKGFGEKDTDIVISNRPYSSIREFMDKTNLGKGKFESLLFANAFSSLGDIEKIYNWYYNEYTNKSRKKEVSFLDFGDDFSKNEEENHVTFTVDELKEKCYEMNGFFVEDNLLSKYSYIYDEGLKRYVDDNKSKIYNLREALDSETKELWALVLVKSVERGIKSKSSGGTYDKITLTDGITSINIITSRAPYEVRVGEKLVLPLVFDREEDRVNFCYRFIEKIGIFPVE